MVKLDWDDPAKELTRKELRNAIISFFDRRERRKLTVLHLPGGSDLEYQRVYRPLGIDPSGIVGIEKDPEVYEILQRKRDRNEIPYEIYYGSLEDFMAPTKRRFDIISADTTKLFGLEQCLMIMNLFEREVLSDKGILHTVFVAKRDRDVQKTLYEHSIRLRLWVKLFEKFSATKLSDYADEIANETADKFLRTDKKMTLGTKRSFGITEFTRLAASLGVPFSENLRDKWGYKSFLEKEGEMSSPNPLLQEFNLRIAERNADQSICDAIANYFNDRGIPKYIADYLILTHCKPWFIESLRCYEYTSQEGFKMYGDIMCLDRKRDTLFNLPITLETFRYDSREEFGVPRRYAAHMRRVIDIYKRSAHGPLTPRVDLKI